MRDWFKFPRLLITLGVVLGVGYLGWGIVQHARTDHMNLHFLVDQERLRQERAQQDRLKLQIPMGGK